MVNAMEPPVSSNCRMIIGTDENLRENGTSGVTITSPSHDHVTSQQPVSDAAEEKQKRKWDAWTDQEEEMFFTALSQFGKKFRSIARIVRSKDMNQSRYYYYRFLRRMNKVLSPELCFDAKNTEVTNAAMFQWWTLLKSCKVFKLRLKVENLKIFLKDLKHQFLMDWTKDIKLRHARSEVCSTKATENAFSQGKALVNDRQAVEAVLLDRQGYATSAAAYKSLEDEEDAIYGISLLADAAEQMEKTAFDKTNEPGRGENCVDPTGNVVPSSETSSQTLCVDKSAQVSSKLKLQLFPIDKTTRRALEKDDHNPYLELTLSARKKISSVLEHLNRKWGKSSARGELLIVPYSVQKENLINYQRWTRDSVLTVADVFKEIGSPSIFRLRYCWLPRHGNELSACQGPEPLPGNFKQATKVNNTDQQDVNKIPDFTPVHVPYV